jgi:Putative zinc-finger
VDKMTPPEERHRYQELIGAFLLGALDEVERTAMQTHLSSCPVCQVEVKELEPVVAALADAAPDRIDEAPLPPGNLEESTLAPILGEIHHARRRRRRFDWSSLAAAAIFAVVIGLAGFTWLLEPAVSLPLSFSGEAPGVEVKGNLISHAWGTEIRFVVSRSREGQTHKITLESENGEGVNLGSFIGIGDKPLKCTFDAELSREDATRLEVRTTPGGELVFYSNLPRKSRAADRDWPLFGILRWADLGLQNETTGANGPECEEVPSSEDPPPPDKEEKPKGDGSGGGTPPKGTSSENGDKGSSPGGEKPGAAPQESGPDRGPHEQPPYYQPPHEKPPADDQYEARP